MKCFKSTLYISALALLLFSCKKDALIAGGNDLEDWTASTHGYGATPNYDIVFNQNEVMRLDFVIEAAYWEAMQADLASLFISPGQISGTPMYVPAQMFFNGKQWYDVGLRYKGNSSLQSVYSQGNGKLPFRIEMNHFEKENPNINGQTFYGFTQLSLSSNFKDNSMVHEKVAADVFRDFGVPAPQSAFYRIYIDYGEGPIYFGLYTMLDVAFGAPMLNAQFGSSYGNCYKPDGNGARLNDLSMINSTFFENKTNEGSSLDDITSLVTALLSDNRTNNPALWRSNLEAVIDMDLYLKYLAANTTMQNWDTYGRMTHNYYLYNDPSKNKFVWIPWDNNETFSDGPGGGGGGMTPVDFDFSNMATTPTSTSGHVTWPLISYIYADPVYKMRYDQYIDEFIVTAFTSAKMTTRFTNATNLVQPYVTGANGEIAGYTHLTSASAFDNSLSDLLNFVSTRITEAEIYTP